MSENTEVTTDLPKGIDAEEPISNFEVGQTFDIDPKTMEAKEIKPVDPALVEKLEVLKRLSQIDSLLTNCLFPGGAAADIFGAKQFLQKLHSPILAECQSHPDFARATKSAVPVSSAEEKAIEKRNRKARRASN